MIPLTPRAQGRKAETRATAGVSPAPVRGVRLRLVTLAAVQLRAQPGQVQRNLERATPLVEQAAAAGADLVVLPELFSSGYVPNRAVWAAAEEPGGPTSRWLAATAKRLGIHLGGGCVERRGDDFFNVFVLADPRGRIAGRAFKQNAEANVFRRGRDEHAIETALGRVGVGICADNQFVALLRRFRDLAVDLVLMPHAWPTPGRAGGLVSPADVAAQQRRLIELPALYAVTLGVPVVFVNQVGPLQPIGGLLGRLLDPRIWALRGQSRIVGPDGSLLGELGDAEGVVVATASTGGGRPPFREPRSYGGWLQPGLALERRVIIPVDIVLGKLSYHLSRRRRRSAVHVRPPRPAGPS